MQNEENVDAKLGVDQRFTDSMATTRFDRTTRTKYKIHLIIFE